MARIYAVVLFILISLSRFAFSRVFVCYLNGVVNPPMAQYITRCITEAEDKRVAAVVVLNTPGGLDISMRRIVAKIMNSKVPVITYVYPSGARAASAGLFILVSGHIAAMAPGTNTGAAHPVSFGVKMDKTMREKVTNDAVAFIKSIAKKRGHFAFVLVDMVKKSKSLTEDEARKYGIIDVIASDFGDLFQKIKGRRIKIGERTFVFRGEETLEKVSMSFRERFLYFISHPNVAYLLAVLGFYGILFELSNPGLIFPGIVGFIFLILSFYSLHVLPINYAGAALILFSFLLFLLDVKLATHGLLSIGGFFSFLLGSLMLFNTSSSALKPSMYVLVSASILTFVFFVFIVGLGIKALRKKPVSGKEGLIGERGRARTKIDRDGGWVFVHGELWKAVSEEDIEAGEKIEVLDVDGLVLKVKRLSE